MRLPKNYCGLILLGLIGFGVGCEQRGEIRVYQVDRKDWGEMIPVRTVAAAIPIGTQLGEQAWFIKAMDEPSRLEGLTEPLARLIESSQFDNGKSPKWKLPEGWDELPGSGMSQARFRVRNVDPPVLFSVTLLPGNAANWDGYLKDNLNRWRDQLQLAPLRWDALKAEATELPAASGRGVAMVVDWTGEKVNPRMKNSPDAGSRPQGSGGNSIDPSASADSFQPNQVDAIAVPEGWLAAPISPFQLAKYHIGSEKDEGEVIVSQARNDLHQNAFMWQNQLMPDGDASEVQSASEAALRSPEEIDLGTRQGTLYRFRSSEEPSSSDALWILILPMEDSQSLFIKMRGSQSLLERNHDGMIQFANELNKVMDQMGQSTKSKE